MNNIVSERNINVLKSNRKLLVAYLLAGYPEKELFLNILSHCEEAGTDIFEVGFPSWDPSADGEVIRKAHQMVDPSIRSDYGYWELIRKTVTKPIWLMAYKKDLIDTGFYKKLVQGRLVDALVIPDMSCEEQLMLGKEVFEYGVDVVGFVNQDMSDSELENCFENTALIYQQLYTGSTGMSVETDDFESILQRGKKHPYVKVFAGFGINTPKRVHQLLSRGFDGVIIGTAMIKRLNISEAELLKFIKELKSAAEKAGWSNEIYCNI